MSQIEVRLVDKMGTDLSVVNAARVSFAKTSEYDVQFNDKLTALEPSLKPQDEKLIKYLAANNHWTPFGHASLSFHIKAPIFVARQLVKHTVGFVWNEISRRYVDTSPELYYPENWRKRNIDKKQGSHEDEFVTEASWFDEGSDGMGNITVTPPTTIRVVDMVKMVCNDALLVYERLLIHGVCPEQARMVLPQNMMTEWYWSGTLFALARMCNLRCKKDTQLETREVADKISAIIADAFPVSWKYLKH